MSVPMKKRHIDSDNQTSLKKQAVLYVVDDNKTYAIPKKVAQLYAVSPIPAKIKYVTNGTISSDQLFEAQHQRYTKAGALLKGLRSRENMTQLAFAKKIKVTQANLSLMEHGQRVIGKQIAKRIEKAFGVNYRLFLE